MTHSCKWTNDCQGKKDYDGEFVSVSTRYWPQGGGVWAVHHVLGEPVVIDENPAPGEPPSAHSTIYVGESIWQEKEFEATTPEEVFRAVEEWVNEQFRAVAEMFGVSGKEAYDA